MNRLIIIGANDFQNQLILKAKSLGYETHVFAWEDGAVGKNNADYFYPISIVEKDKILELCREIAPCGVCSIASDLATITVNYVAENLGLPCNKTKFSAIQTNKYMMRNALNNAGITCPKYITTGVKFDEALLKDFNFPIIVKPTDRSGSRCIMKLDSVVGLEKAIKDACDSSFESKAIIEEYIDGDEFSMETITQNGVHHYLATTKKFTTGAPHFIETGHKQPSGLDDKTISKAKSMIFDALTALHVENSAGHSEFKVGKDGSINIIEIGARMGGDCIGSDLVHLSTGNDFVKMVIDVAVGNKIILNPSNDDYAEIKFLFNREDIDIMNTLLKDPSHDIVRISDMDYSHIGKTTDSSTRLGYYIWKKRK
ncbi:MAG: ATP-grasp domain-containing protein [Eubacterium sp.]|nr:ATP-grasp domain-containing protein [Eubacterium sp.]